MYGTASILDEIREMPVEQRMWLAEQIIHSVREDEQNQSLEKAVAIIADDYKNDRELLAFTVLDDEEFL
ncbi:MAG: hypothetical protein LBJ25_03375 [Candidatus Margulisbacteria bacterium]|jgi:hypothetical protein|nr:hypothetical protein [Candidatus Margulisiibacteriota bacterium]